MAVSGDAAADTSRTCRMVVPEGAETGDILTFTVPGTGQVLELPVPDGFGPGDVLEIQLRGPADTLEGEREDEDEEGCDSEVQSQNEEIHDALCRQFKFGDSIVVEIADEECGSFSRRADADGTGGYVWEAGQVFGRFLATHSDAVRGKRVLELGAGSGMAGIVCSMSGASQVMLTDKPDLLHILEANIGHNQGRCAAGCRLGARALAWGADFTEEGDEEWDVVIGSDLLYSGSPETYSSLIRTIESTRVAEVWLAVMWRDASKERAFFEKMSGSFEVSLEFGSGPGWQDWGRPDSLIGKQHLGQLINVAGDLVPLGSMTDELESRFTREQYVEYERSMVQIYKFLRKSAALPVAKRQRIDGSE